MVRHLRGSLRHADGPVATESQRPAHVVVTARFSREYIETDRRPAPLAEEVVPYVIDGLVHHEDGSGNHTVLNPGSVLVVTAHEEVRHELTMQPSQEGRSARWLSIVLRLPWHTEAPPTSVQIKDAGDATESIDGTVRRPVVGPS